MLHVFRAMALMAALLFLGAAPAGQARAADLENTLYLDVPAGRVVIELRPDLAPHHVARIKELVRRGFYDGLTFHRVIAGFMAQTGDPLGTGEGGSGKSIKAEFSDVHFVRGICGMARSNDIDSADSQFFIMTGTKATLDGKYTAWGQVVSGMEYVDAIKAGSEDENGAVDKPDHIIRMEVAADVDPKKS
jgi:peptidylprolyl isomerase